MLLSWLTVIRVRHVPTDLSEGVVDYIEGDRVVALSDGRARIQNYEALDEAWYTIGYLAAGQWQSAVVVSEFAEDDS